MTQAQLGTLARRWIKKLRLNAPAWKSIDVSFGTLEEMGNTVGKCEWSTEHRTALVRILEEPDHGEACSDTIEQTLVHELLHLVLQGYMTRPQKYDSNFEHGLNVLSEVLAPTKKRK